MIPVPQYPLYSATISVSGGSECHYYLDEESGWQITVEELEKCYNSSKKLGVNPKMLVVINPGNPTGGVLTQETIAKIIQFATEKKLVILADEVYVENIYSDKKKFISFKKVRSQLPSPANNVELISFGSASKGYFGECGLRGGYMELLNID